MENYESLMDELTSLNAQKLVVIEQIRKVETKLNKIKEEKAAVVYNEIRNKMSELEDLDYHFEVKIWNNEYGTYEWYDTTDSAAFRYRHKDTVIVDC